MRSIAPIALVCALVTTLTPTWASAQQVRDFVFTDEDGHLVIRFAGAGSLDESQTYEIVNQEFSRMVHDRLHADVEFAGEATDIEWANRWEPLIAAHIEHTDFETSAAFVQCRSATCRIILEQAGHSSVTGHQANLDAAQAFLESFIDRQAGAFEPVFLITAYDQQYETPHIKAFLRRHASATDQAVATDTEMPFN